MAFTVSDAAAACGGISYGPEAEAARAWRCDSREVRDGDGFAAIRGAKTDGHLYIKQAAEQASSRSAKGLKAREYALRISPESRSS